MLNHQQYKMTAAGAGIIAYRKMDEKNTIEVLLSERSASVGEGYGITGGGFLDCDSFNEKPLGAVSLTLDEAFREAMEENLGFEKVIPEEEFRKRGKFLTNFMVRTADMHRMHVVTYYGLCLDDAEFEAVKNLLPGDERKGALQAVKMCWTADSLQNVIPNEQFFMEGKERFYHKHELLGFAALAQSL